MHWRAKRLANPYLQAPLDQGKWRLRSHWPRFTPSVSNDRVKFLSAQPSPDRSDEPPKKPNLAAKTKSAECYRHPLPDRVATRSGIFALWQRSSMQYGVTHFYSLYMYVFDAHLCTCLIFSIITSDNSHSRK